jgi:hypothetical protein
MPRPKSSGTGDENYTPKRARAVSIRRRRRAGAGENIVMSGDIGPPPEPVKLHRDQAQGLKSLLDPTGQRPHRLP